MKPFQKKSQRSGAFFNELSDLLPIIPAKNPEMLANEIIRICTSKEYQDKIICQGSVHLMKS